MSLRDKIKNDYLAARRAKSDAIGVLSTLLGEMDGKTKTFNPPREMTDDEVVALVKKFVGNLDEAIAASATRPGSVEKLAAEKDALIGYLPQQMTAAEIEVVVREALAVDASLKAVMAALKGNHAGRYDGKLASEIAKRVMAEG